MGDIDPTLMQQIFDLPQLQREADMEQDCSADHSRRTVEIAEVIAHSPSLPEDG
ncbi:MAG: hypothetical protein P1U60_10555 [Hyphomonas sp.]|nr:hypothetical protein [Hyphomonas sp.]MDF1806807.1 hypothetical protein [Hyphomonas sp.]